MSGDIQIVKCVCPIGHTLCSVTIEGERIITADELQQRMRDSVAEGCFGTQCGVCSAPRETWKIFGKVR